MSKDEKAKSRKKEPKESKSSTENNEDEKVEDYEEHHRGHCPLCEHMDTNVFKTRPHSTSLTSCSEGCNRTQNRASVVILPISGTLHLIVFHISGYPF